jgi:hypothetical protein
VGLELHLFLKRVDHVVECAMKQICPLAGIDGSPYEGAGKAIDGDFCPVTHDLAYGSGLGREPDLSHSKRLY